MSKIDLETRNRERVHVTKEEIKRGLEKLGLKTGSIVMVHSSLSSFGYVEGGADAVIDALFEVVGKPPDIYKNEQVCSLRSPTPSAYGGDLVFGEPFGVLPLGKLATIWSKIKIEP
jgi:hypothetical protein